MFIAWLFPATRRSVGARRSEKSFFEFDVSLLRSEKDHCPLGCYKHIAPTERVLFRVALQNLNPTTLRLGFQVCNAFFQTRRIDLIRFASRDRLFGERNSFGFLS